MLFLLLFSFFYITQSQSTARCLFKTFSEYQIWMFQTTGYSAIWINTNKILNNKPNKLEPINLCLRTIQWQKIEGNIFCHDYQPIKQYWPLNKINVKQTKTSILEKNISRDRCKRVNKLVFYNKPPINNY